MSFYKTSFSLILLAAFATFVTLAVSQKLEYKASYNSMAQHPSFVSDISPANDGFVYIDLHVDEQRGEIYKLYDFKYSSSQKILINNTEGIITYDDFQGTQNKYIVLSRTLQNNISYLSILKREGMELVATTTLGETVIMSIAAEFANKTEQNLVKIYATIPQAYLCFWTFNITANKLSEKYCQKAHKDFSAAVVKSESGKYLVTYAYDDLFLRLWENLSPTISWALQKHINTVAISKNQIILAGDDDTGIIRAFNATSRSDYTIPKFVGHQKSIYSISFNSQSNLFVSCSQDINMILWDINKPEYLNKVRSVKFKTTDFHPVKGKNDGPSQLLYTSHVDGTIKIWEVVSSEEGTYLRKVE